MNAWLNLILDIALIGLITAGLVQATRLIRHLADVREGREDMERFVREFNGVVVRAETGIKNLRQAARDSGNDLEKLIEKASLVRDELQFITASADKLAARLIDDMSAARPAEAQLPAVQSPSPAVPAGAAKIAAVPDGASPIAGRKAAPAQTPITAAQASRAERELMQALEKLG
jgi:hypothetical protein